MNYHWEYGELASRVYQLDKPIGRSLNGDIEYYTQQLANTTGPILEPAVGTGRLLIPLLQQGLDIRGYDTSEAMLTLCRSNLTEAGLTADLTIDDMQTHREPNTYAAIIVPIGSLILLNDHNAVTQALSNMHDSLTTGGQLYIDLPPGHVTSKPAPMRHWWDNDDLLTLTTMHTDNDPIAQKTTAWLRYELWRNGTLTDTQLQIGGMLYFGLTEFQHLLRDAGFTTINTLGNFHGQPQPNSTLWTFIATKTT